MPSASRATTSSWPTWRRAWPRSLPPCGSSASRRRRSPPAPCTSSTRSSRTRRCSTSASSCPWSSRATARCTRCASQRSCRGRRRRFAAPRRRSASTPRKCCASSATARRRSDGWPTWRRSSSTPESKRPSGCLRTGPCSRYLTLVRLVGSASRVADQDEVLDQVAVDVLVGVRNLDGFFDVVGRALELPRAQVRLYLDRLRRYYRIPGGRVRITIHDELTELRGSQGHGHPSLVCQQVVRLPSRRALCALHLSLALRLLLHCEGNLPYVLAEFLEGPPDRADLGVKGLCSHGILHDRGPGW